MAAPAFALAPGLLRDEPIDYHTSEGAKLFKSATEKLQTDFDLASSNLKVFLAQIKRRSEMHGWETLFQIPEDPTVEDPLAEDLHHVINSYGTVTFEQV